MSWHKAGMTERIANIMLSGAVCISDETTYLRDNFIEDEEIVLFKLDKLEELPGKINRLLEDDALRKQISKNAYEKAKREHTWEKRAQELLELCAEAE
jgi:spore maturation protein CgeB